MSHAADEAALLALEAQRGEALLKRDRKTLERLLADDLVHVHSTGIEQNKTEVIDYAMNTLQFLSVSRQNLRLRFYGDDVAIMNSGMINSMCRSDAPERIVTTETLVTQVWVRSGDSWKQVSFHSSRTPEKR